MFKFPVRAIDPINIGLIILTCVVAHLFPYHLLLFSYAVLGPAHYLTQISWMHDRRYFSNTALLAPAMVVLTLLWIALSFYDNTNSSAQQTGSAIAASLALGLALFSVLPTRKIIFPILAVAGGLCLCWLTFRFTPVALFLSNTPPYRHAYLCVHHRLYAARRAENTENKRLSLRSNPVGMCGNFPGSGNRCRNATRAYWFDLLQTDRDLPARNARYFLRR